MYYKRNRREDTQRWYGRICETVDCLNKGMNTEQIAEELGVSRRTAQKYVKYIRENQ